MNVNVEGKSIMLDASQKEALNLMFQGQSLFLNGRSGAGKSTLIQAFKNFSDCNIVCLAPTGVAAQHISGSTIHSFFKFPIGVITDENIVNQGQQQIEIIQSTDIFIVDEISMVNAMVFDAMNKALQYVTGNYHLSFGGKQIIVVGDFCQLPPVITDQNLQGHLEATYGGIYAFQTEAWADAGFQTVNLETVHRQNDIEFLNILDAIRFGDMGSNIHQAFLENALHTLNANCSNIYENPDDITYLCTTRKDAECINHTELAKLPDIGTVFYADVKGFFPEEMKPTSDQLLIKKGARVMILRNEQVEHLNVAPYANGDVGIVIEYTNTQDIQSVTVQLTNGRYVTVHQEIWQNLEYDIVYENARKRIIQKVAGEFNQHPLISADAWTVHKSQGKTLDRVKVITGQTGFFTSGQLYTALSRVRSMQNLILERPLNYFDVIVDPAILEFYNRLSVSEESLNPFRTGMIFDSNDMYGVPMLPGLPAVS